MPSVTLEEAQARLPELIDNLIMGEELRILRDNHVVATLVRVPPPSRPCQPGSAVGKLTIVDDSDSYLEDFKEYM